MVVFAVRGGASGVWVPGVRGDQLAVDPLSKWDWIDTTRGAILVGLIGVVLVVGILVADMYVKLSKVEFILSGGCWP